MRMIIAILLVLVVFAAPVSAYNITHQFDMKLDGEWELESTVTTAGFENILSLKGDGLAEIYSFLQVKPVIEQDFFWWELF